MPHVFLVAINSQNNNLIPITTIIPGQIYFNILIISDDHILILSQDYIILCLRCKYHSATLFGGVYSKVSSQEI